jgi:hypothetical protein
MVSIGGIKMKSETISKALGREVNLYHERIEDIVNELVEKVEGQKKLKPGDEILITNEDGTVTEAIYQSSQHNGCLIYFKLKRKFLFGMVGVGNVAKIVGVDYGK